MAKRKSDTGAGNSSKKARTSDANSHASAIALVASILADPDSFVVPNDKDTIRDKFVQLAEYARALEVAKADAPAASSAQKDPEEIAQAVDKLRRAAVAGIKKQMGVSTSVFIQ